MNEENVAEILTQKLKALGFIVHKHNAFSTNSIYLKLDYGVCCGIRISDHNGRKKYHYRFNVIKNFKGDKIIYFNNLVSYFYTFDELPQLLDKVQEEKQKKIKKYGIDKYKLIMETEKNENELFQRFSKVA